MTYTMSLLVYLAYDSQNKNAISLLPEVVAFFVFFILSVEIIAMVFNVFRLCF
jgi:hypothetical protein